MLQAFKHVQTHSSDKKDSLSRKIRSTILESVYFEAHPSIVNFNNQKT